MSEASSAVQGTGSLPGPSPTLRTSTLAVLASVFLAAVAAYLAAANRLSLGADAVITAAVVLLLIFALVVKGLHHHRFERFGPANAVTSVRAAIVSLVFAIIVLPGDIAQSQGTAWALVAFAVVALALDGVDGYLARRHGQESELGARFDMEVDALLILCLSGAAYLMDKVGLWVLLIGLMRYGFVLAQYPLPRLRGALPPSHRRKFVCVVQVSALCLIVVPGISAPLSSWLGAVALVLLAYSFAVDCFHLLRTGDV